MEHRGCPVVLSGGEECDLGVKIERSERRFYPNGFIKGAKCFENCIGLLE